MHGEIIDALGGVTVVARRLSDVTGTDVSIGMVSNWKRDGISWRYRPAIVQLARENYQIMKLPDDFLLK